MGLLDFFRRRGASAPDAAETDAGGAEVPPDERGHGGGVPPGAAAEGPPVGLSDPGSIAGDDATDVVAAEDPTSNGKEDVSAGDPIAAEDPAGRKADDAGDPQFPSGGGEPAAGDDPAGPRV